MRAGFPDLVHAADRVEHRRRTRALARGNGPNAIAESRLQERAQLVRIARAAIFKSLIAPIGGIEESLRHEEAHEPRLVLGSHREVQGMLIHDLYEQLVHLTDDIGLDLAHPHALLRERARVSALVVEV